MKRRVVTVCVLLSLVVTAACADKKPKYEISAQPPAACLDPGRWDAEVPRYEESACVRPAPGASTAYEYLAGICACGHRRAGTAAYHCAAAYVRDELKALGYAVTEQTFTFPYYQFDVDKTSIVRVRDGKNFPAFPMSYSLPVKEKLVGKLVRPGRNVKGCFVLVPSALTGYKLMDHYEELVKAGALGVVVEASLSPIAAKGRRHSRSAHTLSWHYSPLPGWVVEHPEELLGATIEAFHNGRIVPGTGVNVIARGPQKTGKPVLVTGHLDSWFEGALDDGTGVAALLGAARALKDSPDDLVFAAVDAEEIGLVGSAELSLLIPPETVKAVIELDMVSSVNTYVGDRKSGTGPRIVTVSPGTRWLAMRKIEPLPGLAFYPGSHFARGLTKGFATDFEWYYARGVPGVFVYVPSYWYHTERDVIEYVKPSDLNAMAAAVADMARGLRDSSSLKAPREIIPLEVSVTALKGDTVEVTVKPGRGFIAGLPGRVTVSAYWNHGLEKRIKMKKGDDGAWRGQYRLARPGDWQFLAGAVQGRRDGKKWVAFKH